MLYCMFQSIFSARYIYVYFYIVVSYKRCKNYLPLHQWQIDVVVMMLACHIMIYVVKPFYWLTYFTTEFETAGETFEISGPNGH